jgi:hypothetical protein
MTSSCYLCKKVIDFEEDSYLSDKQLGVRSHAHLACYEGNRAERLATRHKLELSENKHPHFQLDDLLNQALTLADEARDDLKEFWYLFRINLADFFEHDMLELEEISSPDVIIGIFSDFNKEWRRLINKIYTQSDFNKEWWRLINKIYTQDDVRYARFEPKLHNLVLGAEKLRSESVGYDFDDLWFMLYGPHVDMPRTKPAEDDPDGETFIDHREAVGMIYQDLDDLHREIFPSQPRTAMISGLWDIWRNRK